MAQITLRGVSNEVHRRLREVSRTRGKSVNQTVLDILEQSLDARQRRRRLERYATWNAEDLRAFDASLAAQRGIDDEAWR